MMLPLSPPAATAATPASPLQPGEGAGDVTGDFAGVLAGVLAASTNGAAPALPRLVVAASAMVPEGEADPDTSSEADPLPQAAVPLPEATAPTPPAAPAMIAAAPAPALPPAEEPMPGEPAPEGGSGDTLAQHAAAAAAVPPTPPTVAAGAGQRQPDMPDATAGRGGAMAEAPGGPAQAEGADPARPPRAAPDAAPDAPPGADRTGAPERPAVPGRMPDTAATAEPGRPAPALAPAPPRGSAEPSRQADDMAPPSGDPPDVTAGGQGPAQRPPAQPTVAAAADAAARAVQTPERTLPPPAAGIALSRAAEPRPLRAAAPSLAPPVSGGAVETLNAAAAPADPAPLRQRPGEGPTRDLAERTAVPTEAEMAPELAEAATRASPHADGGSPQPRAPGDTQGTLPGAATQTPTGQTAAQPGLGPAGPPVAQAAAPQAQAAARPAPATPAQQLMPVLVTLAAGAAGSSGAVTVTLDPVELGRVEISVRTERDARARIQVTAERPETLLLLLRDQASLDRALAQAGIGAEGRTLSFDLAAGDGRGQGEGPARDGGGRPGSPRITSEAETALTPVETTRRRSARGALDIAV